MEYRHAMPQLRNRERRRCKVLRQLRNAPERRGAGARGACRTRSSRSSCCSCRAGSAGRTRGDCRAGPTCSSGPAGHPATGRNPAAIRRRPAAGVFRQDYVSVKSKTSFTKRSATFQNTAKVPAEAPSPASSRRASARASSCSSPFRTSPASHGGLSGPSWPSPYRRR